MKKRPLAGFEHSMPDLQFDAYFLSKVVEAHDLMPDLKVGRVMPVVIDNRTNNNRFALDSCR